MEPVPTKNLVRLYFSDNSEFGRVAWTWKSRRCQGGRPAIDPEVRELIRTMSRNNIGWGAPRIHGELKMLGIQISESTVAKYMIRHRKPPSQTWRTFLDNHVSELVSVDFFTVPTVSFRSAEIELRIHFLVGTAES